MNWFGQTGLGPEHDETVAKVYESLPSSRVYGTCVVHCRQITPTVRVLDQGSSIQIITRGPVGEGRASWRLGTAPAERVPHLDHAVGARRTRLP